ncbi:hypothetical protein V6N13_026558 [Hibiscus sabdariffa]|uniref:Uncharacterized protein n=1 Tax=Hibiscus sabdariffa TaxID=183260 RepID=A0ABR2BUY6_9ROSI
MLMKLFVGCENEIVVGDLDAAEADQIKGVVGENEDDRGDLSSGQYTVYLDSLDVGSLETDLDGDVVARMAVEEVTTSQAMPTVITSQTSSTVTTFQSMPPTTSSEPMVFMPTPSVYPQSMTIQSPRAMPTPSHQPIPTTRRKVTTST